MKAHAHRDKERSTPSLSRIPNATNPTATCNQALANALCLCGAGPILILSVKSADQTTNPPTDDVDVYRIKHYTKDRFAEVSESDTASCQS